ncbi:TraB/GumN family protein [Candidatus Woesearchaeota archaeon]|nr:TraB/GumN family protein [Candidatus Woesearchaeota archaeon]
MKYKNLYVLGTSHIAKQSLKEVEDEIKNKKPGIIALELDRQRLAALFEKERPKPGLRELKKIGLKGFLFNLLGAWAEKKLGKETGVAPGSEMKKAFELAKEKNIRVYLIDQDISITMAKISKVFSWKEKWNFVIDILKAVVLRKREVVFDLAKVPSQSVIKKLTSKVKKRYPNLYYVLVDERNRIMAEKLAGIMHKNPDEKILAIIGAGHEEEIIGLVKEALAKPQISYSYTVG